MALYEYRCAACATRRTAQFAMGRAPSFVDCACGVRAERVYGNFQHSEDRCRLFRNGTDGSSFSYSLGMEYPQSRSERNAVFNAIGCEPVTRGTMPQAWKADQEYAEHRKHGGSRDLAFESAQCGSKKSDTTVLSQLQNSNVRIP